MALTPTSDASTSTRNCCLGSGIIMIGVDVNGCLSSLNTASTCGVHLNGSLLEVKQCNGMPPFYNLKRNIYKS